MTRPPQSTVVFPSHIGAIRIEFGAAGPVHTLRSPEVFFSVDGMPAVSVAIRDGEPVSDVLGHDPTRFDALSKNL